jgi:hypothetical protein
MGKCLRKIADLPLRMGIIFFREQTDIVACHQCEGRIAQPTVAIVPVALASELLRQRGRGSGNNPAGFLVGQRFQGQQGALGAMTDASQFNTDRTYPGRWTITFSNPPINVFVPATIVDLGALMTDLEADASVKVVVFQSANPDFLIGHLDVAKAAEQPEVLGLWRDFVLRLSSAPVVSIAKIRGRTRGICNEFVLACDMRFASRQNAYSAILRSASD